MYEPQLEYEQQMGFLNSMQIMYDDIKNQNQTTGFKWLLGRILWCLSFQLLSGFLFTAWIPAGNRFPFTVWRTGMDENS